MRHLSHRFDRRRRRRFAAALATLGLLLAIAPVAGQDLSSVLGSQTTEPAPAEPARGSLAAETTPADDAVLAERLGEIYATVDGLEGVSVEVHSGVVVLGGEALSSAARDKAVRIARQVQGVVEVEDHISEVRDVERRVAPALDKLRARAARAIGALPLFAVALAVVLAFLLLARWIGRWERPFRRLAPNRFLRDLLRQAVRAAVVIAGVVLALELLDATAVVAAVAGAAGLAGLALGFAFRDLVENYVASILLSLRQPFAPNDHVIIEGREGRVVRLTSRATILMTLDGNHVRIPNADVFKGVILNYTRNPRRRFDFTVGVDSDVDLVATLDLGVGTLAAMDGVLDEPPPQGWIDQLGDSNVVLHLFGWIDQRASEWAKARSEAIRRVKEAYDTAGVSMPEPIYNLRLTEARALPGGGTRSLETATVDASGSPAGTPRPSTARPMPAPAGATDISRDTHLDREVADDRAETGGEADLLDPAAPHE